ncbi:maleylpyruvate isomerase family mycothiol-dependent enzyme [Amycolatopsis thermalba]|uniref:maleylpyruvate isomerase family mycothiol-dependent enzyme n=1 Tax=Amycolatopsis thermalba TaxID=944492 RepID=UPI002018E7C8|nr:maleylpyruvate isomerase family mycothiol-dependent enzyme [Amycolatopsis thermalba]
MSQYDRFADLIEPADAGWDTPTRCTGWRVRDVAAHVVGNAVDTADGTIGRRSPDEQAAALRHHDPAELAAMLRAANGRLRTSLSRLDDELWGKPSGVPGRTIGNGVLTLWYDAYVHGDDIRAALGRESERDGGLAAAVHWVADTLRQRGWGPARLDLRGFGPIDIGDGGETVQADALDFVLAASGRRDPAALGLADDVNVYSR